MFRSYKSRFLLPTLPIFLSVLVLVGWVLDIHILQQGIIPGVAMNPVVAIGFLLLGLEVLRLYAKTNNLLVSKACLFAIWVVIIASAMKLSDLTLGTSFIADQQLLANRPDIDRLYPSRIAPNTAICFFLLGWAMQFMRSRAMTAIFITQALAMISTLIALLAIVGYLYGVKSFYEIDAHIPMALSTAVASIFLSIAVLFTHPHQGYMQVFTNGGPAGRVSLILLPTTLIVPILLGWASLAAQRAGLFDAPFDHAVTVVLDVAIFSTLSYISVRLLFFTDLHRQKAVAELHDSAARVNAIFNNVVNGIITTDERGIVETINPAAERLFGYAGAEIVGQNIRMLMPESYSGLHDGYLERYRTTGEAHIIGVGREVEGRRKNGTTFPMYLAISEMKLHNQRYFTGIMRDITDRKQIQQSLVLAKEHAELANRAKGSFLATMSHEIRTPLTGMLGMLEVLSLTALDSDQENTLQAAWDSGRNLLRIVNDILDWSKIEEGKLALAPRVTSIPLLLREVVNTYSRVASAKSLMLRQSTDPLLSMAHMVDGLRLTQVLNNFVSNAIKFTQQGEIELRADLLEQMESGERIRFSVRDTGIGIAMDAQQRLFQNFQQESTDTARMYGGTGLGLAICRRLSELMDGQIELKSESGQGSTFSITLILPISGAPIDHVTKLHPEVKQRVVAPLFDSSKDVPWVLAVDDHPINRDLLSRQIKLLGLRVETVENGQTALTMWLDGRFSLVITDCHMPEMDGYTLSRAIRKIEVEKNLPHTPIIGWTANAVGTEVERCHAAGMDELLVKPTALTQLREVLSRNLSSTNTGSSKAQLKQHQTDGALTTSPIDYSELGKVVADSANQIEVLHNLRTHIHSDHANLIEMLKQGNQPNIERTAHRMKGSSRMVGAMDLARACEAIEQAAQARDIAGARSARLWLDEAIKQFDSHLIELDKLAGKT